MSNTQTSSSKRTTKKRRLPKGQNTSMMNEAIRYAKDMNWPVFPIYEPTNDRKCSCGKKDCSRPAKHPRTTDGFKSATTNEKQIRKWWSKWPNASIGIATGGESGLTVLDIDPKNGGGESFRQMTASHGEIPKTIKVNTGGNGFHFYWQDNEGRKNGAGIGGMKGVDIRSTGGYIIAPPSKHISGGQYSWAESKSPADCSLAPIPPWLIQIMNRKTSSPSEGDAKVKFFGDGSRNDRLTRLAGSLRNQGLDDEALTSTLLQVNQAVCKPPLEESEVIAIAKSISRYPLRDQLPLEWGEMEDLKHVSVQVPPLDSKMIPRPLRKWIVDVCERMQVPLEYVAVPALVGASTIIGRQIAIRPKKHDDFTVIPNTWGAIAAPPSSLKTPAIREALAPVYELINSAIAEYEAAKEEAELQVFEIEAEIKDAEKRMKGDRENRAEVLQEIRSLKQKLLKARPKERRFIVNDSTIEMLGELLRDNPNGLLVLRDELTGFFYNLEKQGHEGDRAFYLESWNGNGDFHFDRIGRGTVSVRGMRLSILGGIQPSRLKRYVYDVTSNSSGNDGLIQRFQMLVYPEPRKKWESVDRPPLKLEREKVCKIFWSLANVDTLSLNAHVNESNSVPFVRFDSEAQALYDKWIEKLENRLLRSDLESEALQTHLGKYRSLMPSLALIFFLLEWASHGFGESVPKWAAKKAIEWCDYLEAHAKKVYSLLGEARLDSAKALIKKIEDGRVREGDSLREIYRHGWSLLSSPKELDLAIGLLKEFRWAQTQSISTGGAPTEVIRLNPKWLDRIKDHADKTIKSTRTDTLGSSGSSNQGAVQ